MIVYVQRKLGDNQKNSLELGVKIDKICRKYNIKYTLVCDTLLGAYRYEGFTPWNHTMEFGMLYEEYMRFLEVCNEELKDTCYYIVNKKTHMDFQEEVTLFAKKSKVILPTEREHERIYYDFTVKIIPIFNSANTLLEHNKHVKYCKNLRKIMLVRKPIKGTTNIHNFRRRLDRYWQYKKYKDIRNESMDKLNHACLRYPQNEGYVLVPTDEWIHKGVVIRKSTYLQVAEIKFEGHSFLAIKNVDQWLKDYYDQDSLKMKKDSEVNEVSMMGPEVARRIQLVELEMLLEIDRICRKHNIKYALFAGTLLGAVRHKGFIPWDDDIDICMLKEEYDKFLKVAPLELDKNKYFIKTQETDKDCNLTFAQLKRNNTLYHRKSRNNFDTHLGIFVDIFPLYNGTDNWFLHKFQLHVCRFLKTMLWSHMGAETSTKYKAYYNLLSKVPNKVSYNWYYKFANMFEGKPSSRVSYLASYRNPFNEIVSFRKTYEDLIEMEFEGHNFYVLRQYDEALRYYYSDDYKLLPMSADRFPKHTAAAVELGDLYELE